MFSFLLENDANVNAQTKSKDSPLHYACNLSQQFSNYKLIQILFEYSANVKLKNRNNETIFDILKKYNDLKVIKFIEFCLIRLELLNLWEITDK